MKIHSQPITMKKQPREQNAEHAENVTEPPRYIPCLDRQGNIYYLHPVTLEKLDRVTP